MTKTLQTSVATPSAEQPVAGGVRVGPAGWSYKDWAGVVYPAPRPGAFSEPAFLAQFFDAIEINTSFYQPPQPQIARQWIERVAPNPRFLFTAKLWQKFTHERDASADDEGAVRAGFDVLRDAGKLGAVLLQFPFSFHRDKENFARLRQLIERFGDYPLVVEVRHATWNDPAFFELLAERGVGFCNIDQPLIGRAIKPSQRVSGTVGYVRLHGRRYDTWFKDEPEVPASERYNYLYSATELDPWAQRVKSVAAETEKTFVITNNHYLGKGIVNALELIHLLTGEKVLVPEALRQSYPRLEEIASEPAREPLLFPLPPR